LFNKFLYLCFIFSVIFAINPVSSAFADEEATQTEATTQAPSEFPPLPEKAPEDIEKKIKIIFEDIKNKFVDFVESNPENKEKWQELLKLKDEALSRWNDFSQDPRGFLEGMGVNDESIISMAESLLQSKNSEKEYTVKKDPIGYIKILSCKTENNGTVLNDISFIMAKDYVMLDDDISPLEITFNEQENVEDISFNPVLHRTFTINGEERHGYAKGVDFPFSFRIKDKDKPVKIGVVLKGYMCKGDNCRLFKADAQESFFIGKLSSLDCNYIKSLYYSYYPPKDVDISNVVLNKNFLKFSVSIPYRASNKFHVLLKDTDKDKPIFFKDGQVTFDGERIKVVSYIDREKTPDENIINLANRDFSAELGYPYYFTKTHINTAAYTTIQTVNLRPFTTGILLAFFSPLLILLMFILQKNKVKYAVFATAQAVLTFVIVYPVLRFVYAEWGLQLSAFNIYLGIIAITAASVAMIKLPDFKLSGVVFALLPFILPCNYLADLFDYGKSSDFIVAGLALIISFTAIFCLRRYLSPRLPEPAVMLAKTLSSAKVFMIAVFVPVIVFTLLSLFLIYDKIELWAFLLLFLLLTVAFKMVQTALIKNNNSLFYFSAIAAVLAVIPLFFSQEAPENNLTESNLQQAIDENKIVYVYADTKWCISCQIGKSMFLSSRIVSSMIKSGKMVVMPADENNYVLQDFRKAFDTPKRPLNILYSKFKPQGELLPAFVQNYEARSHIITVSPSSLSQKNTEL